MLSYALKIATRSSLHVFHDNVFKLKRSLLAKLVISMSSFYACAYFTTSSKVSKMIIWSIQYFGVQARRAAWQPKAILESKFATGDLFPGASITEQSFGFARNRTKMSQIGRRWFIFTRKYYRTKFWSRMKSHQNVPNLPLPIYFHKQVL